MYLLHQIITLKAQAPPQTFLFSALNIFSPKSIQYCIDTTRYLQRRINLYPQVILTRECNPPLAKANLTYATMVVSTAGHWKNYLLPKVEPPGIEGILTLFEVAMRRWTEEVQSALRTDARSSRVSYLSRSRLGSQRTSCSGLSIPPAYPRSL